MKVGYDVIFDKKKQKQRKVNYLDVHYDEDKWVDATKFLPEDFDLLYLKLSNIKKVLPGWSNGKQFEGANIPKDSKVLYWKRNT